MRVRIPQKELVNGASIVSSVVAKVASSMPILSNVLMEATSNGITLMGTDTEEMVEVTLSGEVLDQGETTIPADKLESIVKLMPVDTDINIEHQSGKARIFSESSDYTLMTIEPNDFPKFEALEPKTKFQIHQKTLRHLIEVTEYALPTKDPRRVLLGVFFELKADHALRLTATDGKKLSRVTLDVPEVEGEQEAGIIVMGKFLTDVKKALGTEGIVDVEIADTQITFRFNNVVFRSNAIAGKYPDCDAVIPKEFPTVILLNREGFLTGVRRAGIISDSSSRSIILNFHDNQCGFSSTRHDLGAFSGKISLEYDGKPLEIAMNHQFLTEILGTFHSSEVKMHVKTAESPIIFSSDDEKDRIALLMPIKLSDARRQYAEAAEES